MVLRWYSSISWDQWSYGKISGCIVCWWQQRWSSSYIKVKWRWVVKIDDSCLVPINFGVLWSSCKCINCLLVFKIEWQKQVESVFYKQLGDVINFVVELILIAMITCMVHLSKSLCSTWWRVLRLVAFSTPHDHWNESRLNWVGEDGEGQVLFWIFRTYLNSGADKMHHSFFVLLGCVFMSIFTHVLGAELG